MMWIRSPPRIDMTLILGDSQPETVEALAYVLEQTEMIDGAEVGTYSLF